MSQATKKTTASKATTTKAVKVELTPQQRIEGAFGKPNKQIVSLANNYKNNVQADAYHIICGALGVSLIFARTQLNTCTSVCITNAGTHKKFSASLYSEPRKWGACYNTDELYFEMFTRSPQIMQALQSEYAEALYTHIVKAFKVDKPKALKTIVDATKARLQA